MAAKFNPEKLNVKAIMALIHIRRHGPSYVYGLYKLLNPIWDKITLGQVRESVWNLKQRKFIKYSDGSKIVGPSGGRKRRYIDLTMKGRKTADFYIELFANILERNKDGTLREGELPSVESLGGEDTGTETGTGTVHSL